MRLILKGVSWIRAYRIFKAAQMSLDFAGSDRKAKHNPELRPERVLVRGKKKSYYATRYKRRGDSPTLFSSGSSSGSLSLFDQPATREKPATPKKGESAYEKRREARASRYEELAEKNRAEAARRGGSAKEIMDGIPRGQPILVGHHSEKRHRRDADRLTGNLRAEAEAQKKAEYYDRKAKKVRSNTRISRDDPGALDKLRARLEDWEKSREFAKKVWALAAKNDFDGLVAASRKPTLAERQGFAKKLIEEYKDDPTFPDDYDQEIKYYRGRIRKLEREFEAAQEVDDEWEEFDGGRIIPNNDENRLQIEFDEKPSESVRAMLKAKGFRWSRRNICWQRHLTTAALKAAREVVRSIGGSSQDSESGAA